MAVTPDNPDALLLSHEVAELRRMSESALRQERWRGNGPRFMRDGRRRVLYRARDVSEWLESRLVTPGSPAPQRG